jgi:hypothetical protein
MQPYTVSETEWLSKVPLTATGAYDIFALEAAARRARARMLGAMIVRLASAWKHRAQAAEVQRQVDRAALGIGR